MSRDRATLRALDDVLRAILRDDAPLTTAEITTAAAGQVHPADVPVRLRALRRRGHIEKTQKATQPFLNVDGVSPTARGRVVHVSAWVPTARDLDLLAAIGHLDWATPADLQ